MTFKNFSIRSKFILVSLVTVLVSLAIALSAIAILSQSLAVQEFKGQLNVLVEITAERSQAALAFRDKKALNQNLNALSKLPSVDLACVYDRDGQLFGSYQRNANSPCPVSMSSALSQAASYYVITPLSMRGKFHGHIYVQANGAGLKSRLESFAYYSLLIVIFSCLVSSLIALRMQRTLTLPIIKLSRLSQLIGESRDFSLRAKVFNEDEAGRLAQSFNGLISNIQESQMQMEEMVTELQEKTQQLETNSELMEERNKSIRTMFAGASHDLKQPLQAMTLFANALFEMSSGKQRELVNKLNLAINNMRSLFDDLLDVSKLENRLEHVQTESVALKPLLDSVFHEFDAMAEDKKLELRFHSKDFLVNTNARMLERIVRNLLSNSIRYTLRGGVLLACRLRKTHVHIEIWDTGRGIPKEDMDRIFKSFYQVERKSAEGQQGYGLGLSIVKRLSEELEHPIEINSVFGRGTMFRIIVPLAESAKVVTPNFQQDTPSAPAVSVLKGKPGNSEASETDKENLITSIPGEETRVLLIDDDDLVRDGLVTLIESWRMDVTAFESITAMKAYFDENPDYHFDVIVSDFQLSETENGFDSIAMAREFAGQDTPALIVTGTTDQDLLAQIKESGIRKLKKPVKPAKLRALINHYCGA